MLVVKSFATPIIWVLLLLVLSLVLTRPSERKRLFLVDGSLLTGTMLLWALSLSPVANLLTYPLESQYRRPRPRLWIGSTSSWSWGAAYTPPGPLRQEAELSSSAYPRFYHGVRVFQQNHANLLAFCGGPDREGVESRGRDDAGLWPCPWASPRTGSWWRTPRAPRLRTSRTWPACCRRDRAGGSGW